MRRAANIDAVHRDIVGKLKQAGVCVQPLTAVGSGCPDVLVAWRGACLLLEFKTGTDKLNKAQQDWHASWAGPVFVVRDFNEAMAAVIAVAERNKAI